MLCSCVPVGRRRRRQDSVVESSGRLLESFRQDASVLPVSSPRGCSTPAADTAHASMEDSWI
jgi:hypothetical protein